MAKKVGYHYSDVNYEVGDIIPPYDNMPGLHPNLHEVEALIRSAHEHGTRIRSDAVYLWDDEGRARQQWDAAGQAKMAKKYLYTVEYDDADLLHKGDLNHYTDASRCKDAGARDAAVACYWAGDPHTKEAPRIEVMVSSATVLASEKYKAPSPPAWTDDDLPFLKTT